MATTRIEERNLYTLTIARHLTPPVVQSLSESFRISGLRVSYARQEGLLNVPLVDLRGHPVAFLSWPSKLPGSHAFETVKSHLIVGAAVLVVFLAGIGLAGLVAVRKLRQDEASARHAALHDPLTGLWNRRALMEHLADLGEHGGEDGGEGLIELCLLDLDGFKRVNDSWGHAAGDELIATVAGRLQAACRRASSSPGSAATSFPSSFTAPSVRARSRRMCSPQPPASSTSAAGRSRSRAASAMPMCPPTGWTLAT